MKIISSNSFKLTNLVSVVILLFVAWAGSVGAEPLAFVTNSISGSVTVFDTADNSVKTTVGVGGFPFAVAVHPDGTRGYVASGGTNTVSIIDIVNNFSTASVAVGNAPNGIAVHPNGSRVYVANSDDGTVSVIDTATNQLIEPPIAVGGSLSFLAINPAGTRLYVSHDADKLSIIDTTNHSVDAVTVGNDPKGVAVHPDGTKVYVANEGSNTISVINTATNQVTNITLGSGPGHVAVHPSGKHIYVTYEEELWVIDPMTNTRIGDPIAMGQSPELEGVTVNPAGTRIYVVDNDDAKVFVIDVNRIGTSLPPVIAEVPVGEAPGIVAVTPCQVAVTCLSQCATPWGTAVYDNDPNGKTMCKLGCAVTDLSMGLNFAAEKFNINVFQDPGSLNSFMIENDDFDEAGGVDWADTVRDISRESVTSLARLRWADLRAHGESRAQLDRALCAGNPVAVGVNLNPEGKPGHFVLVTGRRGNDYLIADSAPLTPGDSDPNATPRQTTLLGYPENGELDFRLRGYVTNPPGISELNLSVGDNAELLIVDPAGRRTGFVAASEEDVMEIPESSYSRDALDDDVTGEAATRTSHFIMIVQPTVGNYQLIVTGIKAGPYRVRIRGWSQDATAKPRVSIEGFATVGSTDTYELTFDPAPGQPVIVTQMGNPLLTSLGPTNIWVGLKNSDDIGIRFDLRAEVYRNGTELVGSGEIASVPGGSSGFNNAKLDTIPLTPVVGVTFVSGDTLSVKLLVRNACTGSGKNSGTARLWFNDSAANSRFDATIGSPATYYLRDGFALATTPGPGPKKTIDVAAGAKCSPFKSFGSWNTTMP